MSIEPASPAALADIRRLLDACDLPSGDVTLPMLNDFLVLRISGSVVGSVGLERYADIALLRSLAVASNDRGHGNGIRLLRAIEQHATNTGIRSLYLLTTTASQFFETHGFRKIERSEAPPTIQGTAQFSSLCPSNSTLMMKP